MLSVDQQRCKNTRSYDDIVFYIRESKLDSLRLDFGSVKLYSDNIGSAPIKRLWH